MTLIPPRQDLTIAFGHRAYRLADAFAALDTGIRSFQCFDSDELERRIGEADVVVASFLWRDSMLEHAQKLRFLQSVSAGTDHFPKEQFRERGIRLASAQGSNERAVAEHAMALILSFTRHLHEARDNQMKRHWRGMIGDRALREDELGGKTLVIVGMGRIGSRLARLARAFDMRVVGVKRNAAPQPEVADVVVPTAELRAAVAHADFVALTCPLTPETENLIDAGVLAAMKPSAVLINVARGKVVDEPALVAALQAGRIAGAGLDCTREEPLPDASPLWGLPQVLITPHTAGETAHYEANIMAILMDNLDRLWRGETALRNEVV
jgi:phosphoglycerate dehydrogenase-like enzyme